MNASLHNFKQIKIIGKEKHVTDESGEDCDIERYALMSIHCFTLRKLISILYD